jgi:hypothetical protein
VTCPSDGSQCGNCTATNCCNELASCFATTSCAQDLGAFVLCVSNGGQPATCFFQNVDDPLAFDAGTCFLQNCAAQCF